VSKRTPAAPWRCAKCGRLWQKQKPINIGKGRKICRSCNKDRLQFIAAYEKEHAAEAPQN
jgi:hypothetical protein